MSVAADLGRAPAFVAAAGAVEARAIGEAMIILDRFLEQGEDASTRALELAAREQGRPSNDKNTEG